MKLFKFKVSFKTVNNIFDATSIQKSLVDYAGKFIVIEENNQETTNTNDFVWFLFLTSFETIKELDDFRKQISSICNFDLMTLPTEMRQIDYIEQSVSNDTI